MIVSSLATVVERRVEVGGEDGGDDGVLVVVVEVVVEVVLVLRFLFLHSAKLKNTEGR